MPVEDRSARSLGELVEKILEITSSLPEGRFLWYRGQSCSGHTLLPKIAREGKTSEQVFEREKRLLTRFRQRSMAYWPAGYPQNDWEHLFAMQHFGMPTRLLDWSENLFVATYFALEILSNVVHSHEGACTPVIWCVDPVEWNRSTPALNGYGDSIHVLTTADDELEAYQPDTNKRRSRSQIALFGAHNSLRITAQRGTFMVWGNDIRTLEEAAQEQTARLWKLTLEGERNLLANALRSLGFSETMVFPELPSLSTELSRSEGWRQ